MEFYRPLSIVPLNISIIFSQKVAPSTLHQRIRHFYFSFLSNVDVTIYMFLEYGERERFNGILIFPPILTTLFNRYETWRQFEATDNANEITAGRDKCTKNTKTKEGSSFPVHNDSSRLSGPGGDIRRIRLIKSKDSFVGRVTKQLKRRINCDRTPGKISP